MQSRCVSIRYDTITKQTFEIFCNHTTYNLDMYPYATMSQPNKHLKFSVTIKSRCISIPRNTEYTRLV